MMMSCPACRERYAVSETQSKADNLVIACSACGHKWVERRGAKIVDLVDLGHGVAQPMRTLPATIEPTSDSEAEVRRLVEAAAQAQQLFKLERSKRMRRLRNWAVLGFLTFSPVVAAAAFPNEVVKVLPGSISAYQSLGFEVNVYGLEVRHVEQQHIISDGTRVLTVKGDITNIAGSDRKIPWLRFALTDETGREVYSWTLDTASRPLRAGEQSGFVTRVASPPQSAKNLQIRFAHGDEIGSKS